MRWLYRRPLGPKTTPPCRHCGERVEPWRARPVPFCRHGFAPPPATRERFFVALVPCRALAREVSSAWKRTPRRFEGEAIAAGSSTEPSELPSALITGACPAGAVGRGRSAAFGRGASGRSTSRSRRSSRWGSGRTTRVTGRATARFAGAFAFAGAGRAAGFASAFAGAVFAAVAFTGAAFFAAGVAFL